MRVAFKTILFRTFHAYLQSLALVFQPCIYVDDTYNIFKNKFIILFDVLHVVQKVLLLLCH